MFLPCYNNDYYRKSFTNKVSYNYHNLLNLIGNAYAPQETVSQWQLLNSNSCEQITQVALLLLWLQV